MDADVSVSPGLEGYSIAGAGSLSAFNGAVYDYAFYDTNTDGAAPSYVGAQVLISGLSDVAGIDDKINLWTTVDPSTDSVTEGDLGVRWADGGGCTQGAKAIYRTLWATP